MTSHLTSQTQLEALEVAERSTLSMRVLIQLVNYYRYIPAPTMLGWHVGFWNLVGAIGFTVCGALGFAVEFSTAVEYASAMSTFAGSWAFLVCHLAHYSVLANTIEGS